MSDVAVPSAADDGRARVEELGFHQELKREFGFFHAFALSFADTSLIVAFYGVFALALGAAGPTFFWGLLVVFALQLLVAMVLGEVASTWPVEGGVYQWTREQTGATTGWFSGWAYWWTMVFAMASCAYAAASFILPGVGDATPSKGATIGLAIVITLFGLFINGVAQWILKLFVSIVLVAEIATTIGLGIAFIFFYRSHGVSTLFHSFGGAHSSAFSWLWVSWLGAVAILGWTYLGFEAAGAIAEEVHEPARNVPRAIVGVMLGIGAVVIFVTLASILAIPNIHAAMTGNIADPVIDTVTYHFGSGFEKPVLLLISLGFIGSMVALHTAASRTVYSFGRDGMFPGGGFFTKLSKVRALPVRALFFTMGIVVIILLINIGATQVFNTLLSITVAGFFISYAFVVISQLTLHMRNRHVAGPFTLGRASKAITWIASVWLVFELVNVAWPRSPSLPWYQNWGVIVVTAIVAALGVLAFIFAPRHEGDVGIAPPAQMTDGSGIVAESDAIE